MAKVLTRNQTFDSPGEALAHYGKLGMKWGVRNDRKSGSGKVGSADPTATALIAATIVIAGIHVIKARHAYVDSGRKEQKAIRKAEKKTGIKHEWKKDQSLTGPKTHEELVNKVVPAINKGYPKEPGTSMNCRRCTFAYEMRRRGYDVKATRSLSATGQDSGGVKNATSPKAPNQSMANRARHQSEWGQNVIPTSVSRWRYMAPQGKAESVFNNLGRQPDGSRGELAFSYVFGGGHSLAYEVVNRKPVILDTQSGRSWSDSTSFARDVTPIMGEAAFTRLDNAKLNHDFLKRWVADA